MILFAVAVVAAIASFACGGDDGTSTPEPTVSQMATATATATSTSEVTSTPTATATATATRTATETSSVTATATASASATATAPATASPTATIATVAIPDGYPEDLFPVYPDALVTGATDTTADGRRNYRLLMVAVNGNVDDIVTFYTATLEDAGWTVDFSGTQSASVGGVVGSKGEDGVEGSLIVNTAESAEVIPALEISLFVSLPGE
jgi:hypothetical protein